MTTTALPPLTQYEVVTAKYRPLRTDDLRPGAEKKIGVVAQWQASWVIEDRPYEGQWAMVLVPGASDDPARWPFAWTPECDLEPVESTAQETDVR